MALLVKNRKNHTIDRKGIEPIISVTHIFKEKLYPDLNMNHQGKTLKGQYRYFGIFPDLVTFKND